MKWTSTFMYAYMYIYCKPTFILTQENFKRFARASLSWIFFTANQSLSYGYYNNSGLDKSLQTNLSEVNCEIKSSQIKFGLKCIFSFLLRLSGNLRWMTKVIYIALVKFKLIIYLHCFSNFQHYLNLKWMHWSFLFFELINSHCHKLVQKTEMWRPLSYHSRRYHWDIYN